jgi:WD40 repeat protein
LAVAPDGSWLASTSSDKTVRIWDVHVGRCVMAFRTGHALRNVVATDGRRIAAAGVRGPYLLDLTTTRSWPME